MNTAAITLKVVPGRLSHLSVLLWAAVFSCLFKPTSVHAQQSRPEHSSIRVHTTGSLATNPATITNPASIPDRPRIRGLVVPRRQANISAAISATITFIGPNNGDSFKKGDTLVAFDCGIYDAELNRAKAVTEAARDTLHVKQKLARSGSVSKLQEILAAAEVKKTQADVVVSQARVAYCLVPAPFDGRVVRRIANAYETVSPRDPLIEIVDDHSVEIRVFVPSRWLRKLGKGTNFLFHVDETGSALSATVIATGASIDNVSQLIELRARLVGPRPVNLLSGMSGDADFSALDANPTPR